MLPIVRSFGLIVLFAFVVSGSTPKAGDAAPPFSLPSATGQTVSLKGYAGDSKLVLVFYRGYW